MIEKSKKKAFILFENIECKYSFFIFSRLNIIRKLCYRIVKHEYFESIILGAIILSSIKLVIDTYIDFNDPSQSSIIGMSNTTDTFFTYFFATESFLKAVAYGFVLNKNSYLRESWSQLDFFIVITSLVDANTENIDLGAVKILRLLRTLRPLRFISHNLSMKLVVTALLESVSGIINVLIVLILVWMMFAILGINLLKDKMYFCNFPIENVNLSIYDYNHDKCL